MTLEVDDHANERRQGWSFHFFHHARAMNLHRPRADVQLRRDNLVGLSARHEGEDLAFAGCEGLEVQADSADLCQRASAGST